MCPQNVSAEGLELFPCLTDTACGPSIPQFLTTSKDGNYQIVHFSHVLTLIRLYIGVVCCLPNKKLFPKHCQVLSKTYHMRGLSAVLTYVGIIVP